MPELSHATPRELLRGTFAPLGATPRPHGVNFALYSRHATEVYLLLFDEPDRDPSDVIRLHRGLKHIWHTFVVGARPGQLYGYKVRGPYDPANGHRFNEHKLLIDPYAKAISGKLKNTDNLLLGYDPASRDAHPLLDTRDNARIVPKSIVVDDAFDWQGVEPPEVYGRKPVIYEVHVKGFTAHPSSGVTNPGTYLGFIEKIPHLKRLGITAVEFLPIHEYYIDDFLIERGLTNYWGYNSVGFFTPESSYAAGTTPGSQVTEFKTVVRELHRAGISVILDVVYNHTGEGNERGPTFMMKGIDNTSYYMLTGPPEHPALYYENHTGCGNSVNMESRAALRLVMDSLRYWVEEMHVDGFRFDLASVLGRERGGYFNNAGSFFDAVSQDPTLQRTVLIAEPWDLGTYQVGNFPVDWAEWNGRFRDTVRRFVKGDAAQIADLGYRLTGSADLYAEDGRVAAHSINFITCHDGFTLNDLVSYNQKHNERNGEDNRDGANDNHSWNCGAEGPTEDEAVNHLREQLAKNHLCLLLFSAGTPMISGGDEFLRTQEGNNNTYCQDNELSWHDWNLASQNDYMIEFMRKGIERIRRHPILSRRRFLLGKDRDRDRIPDISWFGPDGAQPAWNDPECRTLCCRLDSSEIKSQEDSDDLFLIFNAHPQNQMIKLPAPVEGASWHRVLDTSLPSPEDLLELGAEVRVEPGGQYLASARSTVLLIAKPAPVTEAPENPPT